MSELLSLHSADQMAFDRMRNTNPVWDGLDTAANAYGLGANVLLHAGPPFESVDSISMPIMNSACVAAVFEGIATDFDQAEAMIRVGEIKLEPAQNYRTVTPLAAVVSASMPLHRVSDRSDSTNICYAPINGGMRPAMRLGLRSQAVLEHIRWLNSRFADLLAEGLQQPIDLISIAAAALRAGDDCHGRTPMGSQLLMTQLESNLRHGAINDDMREFIDTATPLFLNVWMAASKCLMQSATGIKDSSFVIAAAGNGVSAGIQVAAMPGRWFDVPALPPHGNLDSGLPLARALPAIGDSAVVEALGLGAMALQLSPVQEANFADYLPTNYRERAARLMCGQHPGFGELDCKLGLTARAAVAYGHGPIIGLGILDSSGELGRIGGGIYDLPLSVFQHAMAAIEN